MRVCRCIRTDLCVRVHIFMYLRACAYARVCPCVRTRAVGDRQGRPLPFERRQRAGSAQAALPSALRCVTEPMAGSAPSPFPVPAPGAGRAQASLLPPAPGSGGGFVSLSSCFGGLGAGGGVSLSAEVGQQACNHAGG